MATAPNLLKSMLQEARVKGRGLTRNATEHSETVVTYDPHTYGYWVHARRKQMRAFLERVLQKTLDLDPLIPKNWYSVSPDILKQIKVSL
jgi:hypothetical protein